MVNFMGDNENNEITVKVSVHAWLERVESKLDKIDSKIDHQHSRISVLESKVDTRPTIAGIIGIVSAIVSAVYSKGGG